MPSLDIIKARLLKLKEEAKILETKVYIYGERDPFAAQVHYEKLKQLNEEYLDIDMQYQDMLKEIPPSHEHLT